MTGPSRVQSTVGGARGESFADVARRVGSIGTTTIKPTDSDADVLAKNAAVAAGQAQPLVTQAVTAAAVVQAAAPIANRDLTAARIPLVAREPLDNEYTGRPFYAITVTARGDQLTGDIGGWEIWLQTSAAAAATLSIKLYTRPLSGAANDGAGHAGDVLVYSDSRRLETFGGFTKDTTTHRLVIDASAPIARDPTKLYLLLVELPDIGGDRKPFSFLHGRGVTSGDPSYPQANGYYVDAGPSGSWLPFSEGNTAAVRWLASERPGATSTSANLLALTAADRVVPVGAPAGVVGANLGGAGARLWWNDQPFIQGGLMTALTLMADAPGWVTFYVGKREDDGTFTIKRAAAAQALASGANRFVAGVDYEPFTVEAGWQLGLAQFAPIARYIRIGNTESFPFDAPPSYERNLTICFGGEVSATALPVAAVDTKKRRVLIWQQDLRSDEHPLGWNENGILSYSAAGLSLVNATDSGWQSRASSYRFVRATKRLTRVFFTWTTAGARFAAETIAPPGIPYTDAAFTPSAIEIDGAANMLRIKNSVVLAQGSGNDPGDIAYAALGFPLTVGHDYMLEWTLDRTVHGAVLTDLATSSRSPNLTSGDPAFSGTDTAEGTQNGALSFAFVAGNVLITKVEVFYDAPSPALAIYGDSLMWPVQIPRSASCVSKIEANGVTVMHSSQSGSTSQGALDAALAEIPAARPHTVIIATGVNDLLQNRDPANTRWCIASMINLARRVGARIVLTVLHPLPNKDVSSHNAMIMALAACHDDVDLWRWDKALTAGGDGVTIDTAKVGPDLIHPNAAGATAIYNRLIADCPSVLD